MVQASLPRLLLEAASMSQDEHIRRAILELIASDPDGEWTFASICKRIYGASDVNKYNAVRRVLRGMQLPGSWRLGWRKKTVRLYDPCSDANLTNLEKRIEDLEKKGWHENAAACRQDLKSLRALKGAC
jgi:hypothetical protein